MKTDNNCSFMASDTDNTTLNITIKKQNNPYTVHFDANGGSGSMDNQLIAFGTAVNLSACTFTRTDYAFAGWNTKADGTGTAYRGKVNVTNLAAAGQTVTLYAQWIEKVLTLANASDNTTAIAEASGNTYNRVILNMRTLFKDGKWNTLVLPFSMTAAQIAANEDFAGAEIRELSSASFDDGTLTLNFTAEGAVTGITAGVPCIIKWTSGSNISNPVFSGVTIDKTARNKACDLGGGKSITFTGTYNALSYADADRSVLFLGGENTLYYPSGTATTTIGACRAYFALSGLTGGDKANGVKAFMLNFGDTETGITTTDFTDYTDKAGAWYTLDGRRLSGKPTKGGIYVNGGRKTIISVNK